MEKLKKQLTKATKHIAFDNKEKEKMRDYLVAYMEYKPIRDDVVLTSATQKDKSFSIFSYFHLHHFSGAFMVAVLVATSTFGVSYAANDALPGDLLYGVKVNINEEVKTAFMSSDKSRIEWERKRAEMRLSEAAKLASEGRLDAEKKEKVSRLFAEHTHAVVAQVLATEKTDPVLAAEMSSEFEDSLDTHEVVLARLAVEDNGTPDDDTRDLVEQVHTIAKKVGEIREEAEGQIYTDDAEKNTNDNDVSNVISKEDGNKKMFAKEKKDSANMRERAVYGVQNRAVELQNEADKIITNLDPESEIAMQSKAQFKIGSDLILAGDDAIKVNNLSVAYVKYRKASTLFQKVVQLLEVSNLLSIEIYPEPEIASDNSTNESVIYEKQDHSTSTENINNKGYGEVKELNEVREKAEDAIRTARTLMLTNEGYSKKDINNANSYIKDASAHVLRGEIAMVLEDYVKAHSFFENAYKFAGNAIDLLETAAEKYEVKKIDEHTVDNNNTKEKNDVIDVYHKFSEDTHTFFGKIKVSEPCDTLDGKAELSGEKGEDIIIKLNTLKPKSGTACVQVSLSKEFAIDVVAKETATLTDVFVDGSPVSWSVVSDEKENTQNNKNANTIADEQIDIKNTNNSE